MTEQEFARTMLSVLETLRNTPKVREEDITEEFVEGYEQALDDLAEWLTEEFGL
jgi:molecular chaperone GrpE (heat shock protein)